MGYFHLVDKITRSLLGENASFNVDPVLLLDDAVMDDWRDGT
jgi:hypothetical protein